MLQRSFTPCVLFEVAHADRLLSHSLAVLEDNDGGTIDGSILKQADALYRLAYIVGKLGSGKLGTGIEGHSPFGVGEHAVLSVVVVSVMPLQGEGVGGLLPVQRHLVEEGAGGQRVGLSVLGKHRTYPQRGGESRPEGQRA